MPNSTKVANSAIRSRTVVDYKLISYVIIYFLPENKSRYGLQPFIYVFTIGIIIWIIYNFLDKEIYDTNITDNISGIFMSFDKNFWVISSLLILANE